jgi:hypothetical protein
MPSKTLIWSAAYPAGPVTFASRPPPGSLTRLRTASTGSRIVCPSPSPVMFACTIAAVPSGESCGSPNGEVARSFSSLIAARSAAIARLSALVSPPSRR